MKIMLIFFFSAIMLISSVAFVHAAAADEAVVIAQQDDLTPLYTTVPDSTLKDHSGDMTLEEGVLYYTDMTALALIAGYLILFKAKWGSQRRRKSS